jgi:salicylate hydroxylase
VRIVIVGAGIAGLTLALALRRAGMACELVEQAPQLREIGAGVQIAPNATRILHRLGLAPHLERVGVEPVASELRRWEDNRVIGRATLGARCREAFGAPYYAVHRGDLHGGLRALVPDSDIHLGKRCVRVIEQADGVRLEFADGSSTTADVVVGADGIHSVVREALVADTPRFSGQTIYRGLVPAQRVSSLFSEPRVILWLGPGQHCVCYPIAGGQWINVVATVPAGEGGNESWSATGRAADVVAAYAGWCTEVRHLLGALDSVNVWMLHDRDPLVRWSSERITLVGDAAHSMLPFFAQGANQAIEDAMALATLLRQGAPAAALRRYEELRKERIGQVHRISAENATVLHFPDGAEQQRRDAAMGAEDGIEKRGWLYGYDAELAAAAAAG